MVGEVERSGERRLGDRGVVVWSSGSASVFRGSSFCALDRGTGDPSPVAVETEETLEYRWPRLLSAKVELALDGERERISPTSG